MEGPIDGVGVAVVVTGQTIVFCYRDMREPQLDAEQHIKSL